MSDDQIDRMGRKPIFDDEKYDQLAAFCRLKPTLADCAAFFKCGERTIEDTIARRDGLTFREFREQNLVHTRYDLVRNAIKKARSGDNTMLIFCLKNLAGWSDKQNVELTGKDGGPLEQNYTIDVKDRIKQLKGEVDE